MNQDGSLLDELRSPVHGPAQLWLEEPLLPCEFPYVWSFAAESGSRSAAEPTRGVRGAEDGLCVAEDLADRIAVAMLDAAAAAADDADGGNDNDDLKTNSRNRAGEDSTPWLDAGAGKGLYHQFCGLEIWSGLETWSNKSRSSTSSSEGSPQKFSSPSRPLWAENDPWEPLYPAEVEVMEMKERDDLNASDVRYSRGFMQGKGQRVPKHGQQASWGDNDPTMLPSAHPLLSGWGHETQTQINSSRALPSLYGDMMTSAAHILQHSLSGGAKDSNLKISGTQARLPKQGSTSPWERKSRTSIQPQSNGHGKGNKGGHGQRASWPMDASSTQWSPLQPAKGSGLQAVFLLSNASGQESVGTGVFLPRPFGAATDAKRKPETNTPYTAVQRAARNNASFLQKLVYSGCSPLQKAWPESALPIEWTISSFFALPMVRTAQFGQACFTPLLGWQVRFADASLPLWMGRGKPRRPTPEKKNRHESFATAPLAEPPRVRY